MALPSLATPSQLADALNRSPFTGGELQQAEVMLEWASDEIRAIIGQPITRDTSTVVLYPERTGVVELPAFPVISVGAVEVDGQPVGYKTRMIWVRSDSFGFGDEVTVTFTHGYAPVPPEIVKWTCVLASAGLSAAQESGALGMTAGVGRRSEQIDDYKYSVNAPGAASGSMGGLSLPSGVSARLRATYGAGGIGWVTYR